MVCPYPNNYIRIAYEKPTVTIMSAIQITETIVAEPIVDIKPTKPKAIKKLIKKTEEIKAEPIEEKPAEPIVNDEPEPMTIEEELAELDRIEKETANKKKQLLLKQQFKSQSFKIGFINYTVEELRNMNDKFQKEIENKTNAIALYKQHIVDAEEEIADAEKAINENIDKIAIIKNMNTETDFETEIKEQNLDDEIKDYLLHLEKTEAIAKQIEKPSVKKPSVKKPTKTIKKDAEVSSLSSSDTKKTKTSKDRTGHWQILPEGIELYINYKGHTGTYTKINGQYLSYNVEGKTGEYCVQSAGKVRDAVALNGALMDFLDIIGVERKSMNAWREFKVNVDGKMVSVGDYAERLDN